MAKMEMNRQEEYLNRIDRLKLMDDDFFSESLDIKAVDRENERFNLEIQRAEEGIRICWRKMVEAIENEKIKYGA